MNKSVCYDIAKLPILIQNEYDIIAIKELIQIIHHIKIDEAYAETQIIIQMMGAEL